MNTIAKTLAVFFALCPSVTQAQEDAEAYAEDVLNYVRQYCLDPMLTKGVPDPGDLIVMGGNGGAVHYGANDSLRQMSAVGLGQKMPPGCEVSIMTQGSEDSADLGEMRAQATVRRLSGFVLNSMDAGLAGVLRRCTVWEDPDRLFRWPSLTAAAISQDGSRTILVTGWQFRTMVSLRATDFGPLTDCDLEGGL